MSSSPILPALHKTLLATSAGLWLICGIMVADELHVYSWLPATVTIAALVGFPVLAFEPAFHSNRVVTAVMTALRIVVVIAGTYYLANWRSKPWDADNRLAAVAMEEFGDALCRGDLDAAAKHLSPNGPKRAEVEQVWTSLAPRRHLICKYRLRKSLPRSPRARHGHRDHPEWYCAIYGAKLTICLERTGEETFEVVAFHPKET